MPSSSPTPSSPPPRMAFDITPRRSLFKRDQVVAVTRVFVWVVPLTILIWIWAEREQVLFPYSPNVTNIPILITSSNSQLYIEPSNPEKQTVNLKISGPQEAIDHVRQALTESVAPRGITIDLGNSVTVARNQPVDIVSRIQDMALFKQAGVTVEESQPKEMLINVDTIDRRVVDVQAPPDVTNLTGPPVFTPGKVTLTGPRSVLKNLEDTPGRLRVYAQLSNNPKLKIPGDYDLTDIPVAIPEGGEKIRIEPTSVSAKLTVRSADQTFTIRDGIPIFVSAPGSLTDAYKVIVDPSIADTTVVGPPKEIARIGKDFVVRATLEVTNDDIGRPVPRQLTYTLPDGVKPTEESQRRTVEFKVIKRDAGG